MRIYFLRERGDYKSMVLEFPNPIWHIQQENLGFGNVSEFHFQTFNLEISFSLSFIFFIDHPVLDYREPMLQCSDFALVVPEGGYNIVFSQGTCDNSQNYSSRVVPQLACMTENLKGVGLYFQTSTIETSISFSFIFFNNHLVTDYPMLQYGRYCLGDPIDGNQIVFYQGKRDNFHIQSSQSLDYGSSSGYRNTFRLHFQTLTFESSF